jgi:hypothetical protein
MKRAILTTVSVLALFSATPAFAQDSRSTISQTGNNNNSSANQAGANTADSFIVQNGNNNVVGVTQSGTGNASTIEQIDFVGNNHPDPIINNRATVNQSGTNNYSDIKQDGRRNIAEVTMTGTGSDNGIQPPRPSSIQGFRDRQNRESYIEQVGDDNFASLTQHADFSRSIIRTNSTPDVIPGRRVTSLGLLRTALASMKAATFSRAARTIPLLFTRTAPTT